MIKRIVWRKTKKVNFPKNCRCVKSKWLFKVKTNGVLCARLVACGYSQVPGVQFSKNYSPVVHNITYRVLILAIIIFGLSANIVDVETKILY